MKGLSRFDLFELVRDATEVGGAQFLLLIAIAWRANPRENYSCFPSYQRLAEDTHCTQQALRAAARKLEEAKLIWREKRRNRSNVFYLNVALLLELQAGKKTSNGTAKNEPDGKRSDPFNSAQLNGQGRLTRH